MPLPATAATEARRQAAHRAHHAQCFACGEQATGGLALDFRVQDDGSVAATWHCPVTFRSYDGILHGGLISTLLDSAMVHALFARELVGRTAELNVRYLHPVITDVTVIVTAQLVRRVGPLCLLEAQLAQRELVRARAAAKFMLTPA